MWADNLEYVRKALELPGEVRIIKTDDAALATAEGRAAVDPQNKAKDVTPLEPEIHPFAVSA